MIWSRTWEPRATLEGTVLIKRYWFTYITFPQSTQMSSDMFRLPKEDYERDWTNLIENERIRLLYKQG
jgi:hypothetical protein